MKAKAMPAAIWLQPHGQQQQMLQSLISALAKQHGTAPFRPHLTVCSATDWDPAKNVAAADYIRRSGLLPLTVRKAGISYSTTSPLRAVVIDVEDNAELGAFREALRRISAAADLGPPHISLLYTIDPQGERLEWCSNDAKLRGLAQHCAAQIEASEFPLGDPVVIASEGDWTNVKSWRFILNL
jgi:2'-5' RNA ligase